MRQAILVAARELFLAEGVRNVSLRRIAQHIEYSPATLYTYFRCKDEILMALADQDAEIVHQRMDEAMRDVVDPIARVRRALRALHGSLNSNPLFVELMVLDSARHLRVVIEKLISVSGEER